MKITLSYTYIRHNKNKTYRVPDGIMYIGEWAFANTLHLECIQFSETLEEISACAFYSCQALKSITIPSSVRKIENATFMSCEKLEEAIIEEVAKPEEENLFVNFNVERKKTQPCVKEIGFLSFAECINLYSVSIPSEIKHIEKDSFKDCSNITLIVDESSDAHRYALANGIKFSLRNKEVEPSDNSASQFSEIWKDMTLFKKTTFRIQ